MQIHSLPRLSVVAAALALAFDSQAQVSADTVKPATAAVQKVEIKGSASAYDARRDDTASKIVLGQAEIVKHGDTNLLDVLKRLPGVTVSGAAGRGGEIRMRGLGSGYTQVLINGERAPAGFSIDSLAPELIERIEVMRAASAEFSTQSIAGTINIVLKKTVSKAQREFKGGVAAGRGLFNPTLNLQLSDRKEAFSYSMGTDWKHTRFERDSSLSEEGFAQDGTPGLLRSGSFHEDGTLDLVSLAPRVNWTLVGGDTLTWQGFFNYSRFARQSQAPTSTQLGAPAQYPLVDWTLSNRNTFFRSDLAWVKKLAEGKRLEIKIGGVHGDLRNDSYRLGFTPERTPLLDNHVRSRGTDRGLNTVGKFITPVVEGHALAFGWDGGIDKRVDRRTQVEQPLPGAFPVNSDETFSGEVRRLAVFGQDEWNITPRWSMYAGLRWEGIRTTTAGAAFDGARSRSSVFSPIFQTLYKLEGTKGDQLRLALTRTYKAPATQSLIPRRFTVANNSSTEPDFSGNPNLKPELALGIDAAYEHYWGEGALVSVSASVRRIDDYTRTGVSLWSDGRWVASPENSGRALSRGLEFEAKFPLSAVMQQAPALDLRLSLSRNWSSVDEVPGPDNRLDQQTPFSATLGMDYKRGPLTAGGSYVFRNGGPVRISIAQSAYQSVRRDLELYGLWKFDQRHQLRLALSNILGQDFINQNSYADAGGSVHRRFVYPGDVSLRAVLEMKF